MGNNYLMRLGDLLRESQDQLQYLMKEKDYLEYEKGDSSKEMTLGFLTSNRNSKNNDKKIKIDDNATRLKKITSEIPKLKKLIKELRELESFSSTIDDLKIVNYVDGHLDEEDNKQFERLIKVDDHLKKEIELMKTTNSFFGEFDDELEDEIEDMDESVLQNWLEIEEKAKKKLKYSAENKVKPLDILSKLKEIITFKQIEVSFAALAPVALSIGLFYGANTTISASNPALIQLALLSEDTKDIYKQNISNKFPGSNFLTRSGDKMCNLPDTNIEVQSLNKYFNVRVTNPNTKKIFNLSNNDKLLVGNNVDFYFKFYKEGQLYVDSIINYKINSNDYSNTNKACETENLLNIEYIPDDLIKLGDTFRVNPPLKEEMLLISFLEKNTSKRLILGKLIYQPTNLKTFNEKFLNIKWNINDNSISLQTKNLYKLYSEIYTKPLYAPKIKSWKNSKIKSNDKDVFIDFDGNGKAEMVAITDQKNQVKYYVLDTNGNSKGDVLVYPKMTDNILGFELLIDTNHDGKIDQIAEDKNGNWTIDLRKNL